MVAKKKFAVKTSALSSVSCTDNDIKQIAATIENLAKQFQNNLETGGDILVTANELARNIQTFVFTLGEYYDLRGIEDAGLDGLVALVASAKQVDKSTKSKVKVAAKRSVKKKFAKKFAVKTSKSTDEPVAPTEEMVAMLPLVPVSPINIISAPPATTVKDIVNQLIERDLLAWTALPQDFKDMMLTEPAKFTIIPSAVVGGMPHISYVGVEFMWDGSDTWRLVGLRK